MRILLVNTSELTGGAAIAAHRLLIALRRRGHDARMLVRDAAPQDNGDNPLRAGGDAVIALHKSPLNRLKFVAERAEIFVHNGFSRQGLFSIDHASHGIDLTHHPAFREADVIHLHWTNQGMLSLRDIRAILRSGKRVVWTLHDEWAFTGVCHYADQCEGWLHSCGNCPHIRHGKCSNDLSRTTFRRKAETYRAGQIRFVTCSQWLCERARRAPLLAGHSIVPIPNCIDTAFYAPASAEVGETQQQARHKLGLPADKRLVLFVAYKVTDDKKGFVHLRQAMQHLHAAHPDIEALIVGREATAAATTMPCKCYPFEYVADRALMRSIYRASDVLAMPTLMDNLPNTVVEAMACGLPCVASRVGGLPQMIAHQRDGILFEPRDAKGLADGLTEVLDDTNAQAYSTAARQTALDKYSEEVVTNLYLEQYN